jgi:hypothetical protein
VADLVALPTQLLGKQPRAFASPPQRRHRIASRGRINQEFQIATESGVIDFDTMPPTASTATAVRLGEYAVFGNAFTEFTNASGDRGTG